MPTSVYENLSAKKVLDEITGDRDYAGRLEAIRTVSDLLLGHITPTEFDNILTVIKEAYAVNDTLPEARQIFNSAYLRTVDSLINIS